MIRDMQLACRRTFGFSAVRFAITTAVHHTHVLVDYWITYRRRAAALLGSTDYSSFRRTVRTVRSAVDVVLGRVPPLPLVLPSRYRSTAPLPRARLRSLVVRLARLYAYWHAALRAGCLCAVPPLPRLPAVCTRGSCPFCPTPDCLAPRLPDVAAPGRPVGG